MNPSICFPQFPKRLWRLIGNDKFDAVIVCECAVKMAIAQKSTVALNRLKLKSYLVGESSNVLSCVVGIVECPYCRTIIWDCNNVKALIRLCEAKERESYDHATRENDH